MSFKFENLRVWQASMDFGEKIFELTKTFPKEEMYNLSNQILRASDSIALNIAEGSTGQSNLEQKKFVGYSIRSLAEVVTCLHKVKRRNYIKNEQFEVLYNESYVLMNGLIAFRNSIK